MRNAGTFLKGYVKSLDKWLLLFWLSASGLSAVFLSGLLHSELLPSNSRIVYIQLAATGLGLLAALIIAMFDYRTLLKLWKLYVPICVIIVGITFTSLVTVRGDNASWIQINIGSFSTSIQPSELLKISFITTFSMHLAKVREQLNKIPQLLLLCLHGGAHVALIQYQGDTGSALVFLGIFIAMIFCAGINWRYILAGAAAAAALIPTVVWPYLMSDDQRLRFQVLWDPSISEAKAWQQGEALRAFVTGGIGGTGIFSGKHVYVAEAYNDFLFSFIGEATGFIGCVGVIALLLIIAFKVLFNSGKALDDEGRFICVGVFSMIVVQMIINIGMNIRVMPVIGVTLPLFSSGGSSVLSMYLGLGLVLSVYRQSRNVSFFG